MKKFGLFVVAASVAVAIAVPASALPVSFDGKSTSFHTSAVPIVLAAGPGAPVLVGTITKGKKGNVLKIDAMVTSELLAPLAPWTLNAFVDVNGTIAAAPSFTPPFGAIQDCSASAFAGPHTAPADGCTVSGTWLVDLDAEELASPGCCIGVPLTITLSAGTATNGVIVGIPASATLSVKMEKKK